MRESSKFRQGVQLCYRLLYSVQRGGGFNLFLDGGQGEKK